MFTKSQYDVAIKALQDASTQLEPDRYYCACCGDSGHRAFECGFNPLVAMALCKQIATEAENLHVLVHNNLMAEEKLHEILHWLAGHDSIMGEQVGPAKIRVPK